MRNHREKNGLLWLWLWSLAYNLADGSPLGSAVLDSAICREGLIATDGRLCVACSDGTVRCYGAGDAALKPDEAK